MQTPREIVASLSQSQVSQLISDYVRFERDGYIDDCQLRLCAQRYIEGLGVRINVAMIMLDLAFECYRRVAIHHEPSLNFLE